MCAISAYLQPYLSPITITNEQIDRKKQQGSFFVFTQHA